MWWNKHLCHFSQPYKQNLRKSSFNYKLINVDAEKLDFECLTWLTFTLLQTSLLFENFLEEKNVLVFSHYSMPIAKSMLIASVINSETETQKKKIEQKSFTKI